MNAVPDPVSRTKIGSSVSARKLFLPCPKPRKNLLHDRLNDNKSVFPRCQVLSAGQTGHKLLPFQDLQHSQGLLVLRSDHSFKFADQVPEKLDISH